jgi:hypothetical protein
MVDPLNIEVTSPDQAKATVVTPDVVNVGGENVEVNYQSSQSTSGNPASSQSNASLTVNGVEVPVKPGGSVRKTVRTSGNSSSVIVNVDSQSSSSGQSGGGN